MVATYVFVSIYNGRYAGNAPGMVPESTNIFVSHMPNNNKPHPISQLDIEFVDDTFLQTYNLIILSYALAFFVNLTVDRVDPLRIYNVNLLIYKAKLNMVCNIM